jgi:hypothetical protein
LNRYWLRIAIIFAAIGSWVFFVIYAWYDFVAIGIWGATERPALINGALGMPLFWLGFGLACLVAFGGPALLFIISFKPSNELRPNPARAQNKRKIGEQRLT